MDREGRTIWIAGAHRGDGKRFVVHADEKLTAFLELERAICLQLFGLGLLILFFSALAMCDRVGSSAQREAQRQAQGEQEQRELENLVERHSFAIGMTKDQVTRALGQPVRVNRTVKANSVSEQWIYELSGRKTIYLYIDDGILRSFQD